MLNILATEPHGTGMCDASRWGSHGWAGQRRGWKRNPAMPSPRCANTLNANSTCKTAIGERYEQIVYSNPGHARSTRAPPLCSAGSNESQIILSGISILWDAMIQIQFEFLFNVIQNSIRIYSIKANPLYIANDAILIKIYENRPISWTYVQFKIIIGIPNKCDSKLSS